MTPDLLRPDLLRIERVGADGDGVARGADGAPVFVPFSLPGEVIGGELIEGEGPRAASRGPGRIATARIVEASDERVAPPCPHFGACGGCALQHWSMPAQAAWKAGLVAHALRQAGFACPELPPALQTPPQSRRRMDLAVARAGADLRLGLHGRGTSRIEPLGTCLVLHPALVALLAPLRPLLAGLSALRKGGSVVANRLENGIDLLLRLDAACTEADRRRLLAFALAHDLARLSIAVGADAEPEPVCVFRPPLARFAGTAVEVPPGAFLQASAEGEAGIVGAVARALPQRLARRAWIADLYAGCGTLTFPLAALGRVAAFEGDDAAASSLRRGANAAGLGGRITVESRDLARRPLAGGELSGCTVAVLDPPYGGAGPQMAALAEAGVPCVIHVGCNPRILARDAAALRAAGYRLVEATAIDQFLWSARVESVSVFARPASGHAPG